MLHQKSGISSKIKRIGQSKDIWAWKKEFNLGKLQSFTV